MSDSGTINKVKKREDDIIYQYTNLDSLAMILKSQKIRFRNLCLMDDPLEQFVKICDYDSRDHHLTYVRKNYGKFCFVSCWTYEKQESIAMWDMYGDRKCGVRIALPQNMFDSSYDINEINNKSKKLFETYSKSVYPQFFNVDYNRLDDPQLVIDDWKIELGNLGKFKKKEWGFQCECRFRLYASKDRKSDKEYWFIPQEGKSMDAIVLQNPSSKEYVDYPLNENAIKSIRIMEGPNMPESQKVLLDALLKQFGIGADRHSQSELWL